MSDVYVSTIFSKTGLPLHTCIDYNNNINYFDLYIDDTDYTIGFVQERIVNIAKIIANLATKNRIILTDTMAYYNGFNLSEAGNYNIYDQHIDVPILQTPDIRSGAIDLLHKLKNSEVLPYQLILSNAASVYHSLTKSGLLVEDMHVWPKWSLATYSGRSKSMEFNIQGFVDNLEVRSPYYYNNDILLHFDWISADIRIAALLADDDALVNSFNFSDPYSYLSEMVGGSLSREDCKLFILKCINSCDHKSLSNTCYKKLGRWVENISVELSQNDYSKSVLGRKFYGDKEHFLSKLNGIMQGSVAHAMHIVMKKIWDKYNYRIICDSHDSIIIATNLNEMKEVIQFITPIMLHPFDGILSENPNFPFTISVGKVWRKWSKYKTIRTLDDIKFKTIENTTKN